MCKLIGILCFFFVIIKVAECDNSQETTLEADTKASNTKITETTTNQETTKINETSSSEEIPFNIKEKNNNNEQATSKQETIVNEPEHYDRSGNIEETESTTEINNQQQTDSPKTTMFVGSLARTIHDALNNENDSDDEETDSSRMGADNNSGEAKNANTGEVFIYTPPKNTMNQDPVLDLKARSGRVDDQVPKGDDTNEFDEVSRMGHMRRNNDLNLRSGLAADDDDDVLRPPDMLPQGVPMLGQNGYAYNYPAANNKRYPLTNRPNRMRPESTYQNSPRVPPLHYEPYKSREMLFPTYSSREITSPYAINLMKSYFSRNYPNNQLFNPRPREICSTCNQPKLQNEDLNFRRSEPDMRPLDVGNRRSADFDPSSANNYPLQVNVEDAGRSQNSRSSEVIDPGRQEKSAMEVERSYQPIGPLTTMLMGLPPYNIPRNGPMLRMGLNGGPRSIL